MEKAVDNFDMSLDLADACVRISNMDIRGAGRATVWATETLEVAIRGMGQVAYRGRPTLTQRAMPMGTVTALDRATARP